MVHIVHLMINGSIMCEFRLTLDPGWTLTGLDTTVLLAFHRPVIPSDTASYRVKSAHELNVRDTGDAKQRGIDVPLRNVGFSAGSCAISPFATANVRASA